MPKYKGIKPPSQPRSLRSITEQKTTGEFPAGYQGPENLGAQYKDPAQEVCEAVAQVLPPVEEQTPFTASRR
jgi:hypothetical protein